MTSISGLPQDVGDLSVGLLETSLRLGPIEPETAHDEGGLDMSPTLVEEESGLLPTESEDTHQDPLTPVLQLLTGDLEVDHQIPIDLPELDHRRRTDGVEDHLDRKSTRLNSSHVAISYAVFCLKKKQ